MLFEGVFDADVGADAVHELHGGEGVGVGHGGAFDQTGANAAHCFFGFVFEAVGAVGCVDG